MNKRKQYAKGFAYGRMEHKFEHYMTMCLIFGILVVGISLLFSFDLIRTVVLFILCVILILRLVTAFAHGSEKHWMDSLRFRR